MAQAFQDEFNEMPIVTKTYMVSCLLTSAAVQLDLVTPYKLYFNSQLIFGQYEIWRILTTFLFFGTFGFNFLLHFVFIYRYCRMLEEGSFRGRTADMVFMFIFGMACMSLCGCIVNIPFLGHAFTFMLVYVWSKRNTYMRINFFGFLNFQAPYLPWALLGFSVMFGNPIAVDVLGLIVGHIYFYLEDILPNQMNGLRILKTPRILERLFNTVEEPSIIRLPEDLVNVPPPGGYDWGEIRAETPAPDDQPDPSWTTVSRDDVQNAENEDNNESEPSTSTTKPHSD